MRRLLPAALLGLLVTQTPAPAQRFGEDRTAPGTPPPAAAPAPPPAAATPAVLPSFPTGAPATTPRTAQRPAAVAAEPPHEWAVRADNGDWMVCVKSYVGEHARAHAVELADVIRRQHKAAAYLFERNAEERQREEQRQAEFRAARAKEFEPFLQVQAEMKQRAAAQGVEYVETPARYRMPKVTVEPQWAVLVGGFKDADAARKALDTIRTWPAPANTKLMDFAVSSRPVEGGKPVSEAAYINPYKSALVVPNPAVKRAAAAQANALDPLLVKYNSEEPLSLLKCTKGWTLIVKDFTVPSTVQSKDQESSVMARLFSGDDSGRVFHATAQQANELARALRSESMERAAKAATRTGLSPRPLDSYILHHRTGSRVTVGQFDGPDDPALGEMQRLLANMYFQVWDKPQAQGGRMLEERRMFDGITPMPIPKQ